MRHWEADKGSSDNRQRVDISRYVGRLRDLYEQGYVSPIRLLPYMGVRFNLEACAEKLYRANGMGRFNGSNGERIYGSDRYTRLIQKEIDELKLCVEETSDIAAIAFDAVLGVDWDIYGVDHILADDKRNEALETAMFRYRNLMYSVADKGHDSKKVAIAVKCRPPSAYIQQALNPDGTDDEYWYCKNVATCPFCRIRFLSKLLSDTKDKKTGYIEPPKLEVVLDAIPSRMDDDRDQSFDMLKQELVFKDMLELTSILKKLCRNRNNLTKKNRYLCATRMTNIDADYREKEGFVFVLKEVLVPSDCSDAFSSTAFDEVKSETYTHEYMTAKEALSYVFGYSKWNYFSPDIYLELCKIGKMRRYGTIGKMI
jgi:hypothetical protein